MLRDSEFPLRKEELIEKVWIGEAYTPSADAKFYKLVERLQKAISIRIENSNCAYRLNL